MFDSIHEECGVFGIYEKERSDVASSVYFGLYALQHRGQESCGITVSDDGVFRHKRADGLVSEVIQRKSLRSWTVRILPSVMYVTQQQADTATIIFSRLLSVT